MQRLPWWVCTLPCPNTSLSSHAYFVHAFSALLLLFHIRYRNFHSFTASSALPPQWLVPLPSPSQPRLSRRPYTSAALLPSLGIMSPTICKPPSPTASPPSPRSSSPESKLSSAHLLPHYFFSQFSNVPYRSSMGIFTDRPRLAHCPQQTLPVGILLYQACPTALQPSLHCDFYVSEGIMDVIMTVTLVRRRPSYFNASVQHFIAAATNLHVTLLTVFFSPSAETTLLRTNALNREAEMPRVFSSEKSTAVLHRSVSQSEPGTRETKMKALLSCRAFVTQRLHKTTFDKTFRHCGAGRQTGYRVGWYEYSADKDTEELATKLLTHFIHRLWAAGRQRREKRFEK